eukprot:1160418-Pelagomonas_calceolata.AAC.4
MESVKSMLRLRALRRGLKYHHLGSSKSLNNSMTSYLHALRQQRQLLLLNCHDCVQLTRLSGPEQGGGRGAHHDMHVARQDSVVREHCLHCSCSASRSCGRLLIHSPSLTSLLGCPGRERARWWLFGEQWAWVAAHERAWGWNSQQLRHGRLAQRLPPLMGPGPCGHAARPPQRACRDYNLPVSSLGRASMACAVSFGHLASFAQIAQSSGTSSQVSSEDVFHISQKQTNETHHFISDLMDIFCSVETVEQPYYLAEGQTPL